MATTTTNPMMDVSGLPRFASIQPRDLSPAVETLLENMEKAFQSFETSVSNGDSLTYNDVLPVVERMQYPLGFAWGVAGHLNGVKNSDELRDAYQKNQPEVVKALTKFSQSKPLYDALESLSLPSNDDDSSSFENSQMRRAVEQSLLSMKLGGVGFEEGSKEKERFNEIKLRLAELSTKFSNNVLDATKAFSLIVTDKKEMEGVPSSAKGMWASSYVASLDKEEEKGEGEESKEPNPEEGPWRIGLDGPSYIAAMSHLKNSDLRKKVYLGYTTRASEEDEEKNNIPLIQEILTLKQEQAKLLGYPNYAEVSLAKKMAPSVQSVLDLSNLIAEKALPAAKKELQEVTEFAIENGFEFAEGDEEKKLEPWDVTFWSERLKESKFDLTEEQLRPYFALPAVLDGMFGLVERIFGIEVKQAEDGDAEVWHPDVKFFNVFDAESKEQIASFYLDPYSRPADKRGGAWMDVCIGKSDACEKEIPVAYLVCNGSPPVGDKPSLMTFREVETLFHEFGHGLQHMLTKARVGDVAGINGVEWDAVELPSQFMENWCYDEPTVYGFAKHYETGEALPKEMFEKLKEQKTFKAGLMACRQLYFGMMDMELHSNYDPTSGDKTIFDVQKEIAAKYVPHALPLDSDRFLCAFSHIFAGGYSAGYYSYKWAEVMSADAFGAFEDVGLENEEEVKRVGRLFRDTVLSLGGGVTPNEVFERFRGRGPSPDALLRHNGLL